MAKKVRDVDKADKAPFNEKATHELLVEALTKHRFYQRQRIAAGNMVKALARSEQNLRFPILFALMEKETAELETKEESAEEVVKNFVHLYPIWHSFFKNIRGVKELSAGWMIGKLDPYEKGVAQLYHYAGLHVINTCTTCKRQDNMTFTHNEVTMNVSLVTHEGVKICGACYVIDGIVSPFTGRAPRDERGQVSDWNPQLRSKMLGAMGASMLKAVRYEKDEEGNKLHRRPETVSIYAQTYYDYKHRLTHSAKPCGVNHRTEGRRGEKVELLPNGCTLMHTHKKAIRYMVKLLVRHYWEEARKLKGLPIRPSYAEEFLGRKHHHTPKD